MTEPPRDDAPKAAPPGWGRTALTALLAVWFAVKAGRWWLAVADGRADPAAATTWQWVQVGFYHVAVVAGGIGIIAMIRERAVAPRPDAPPAEPTG